MHRASSAAITERRRQRGAANSASADSAITERVGSGLALVLRAAATLHARYGYVMEWSELRALGNDGLLRAARAYRPERGVPFGEYAQFRVFGAILDGIRVELANRRVARAAAIAAALLDPTPEQHRFTHADHVSIYDPRLRATVRDVLMASDSSVVHRDADPEAKFVDAALAARLRAARQRLAPDQQQLVALVYDRGLELREVAALLGLPYITVRRLHKRALHRLAALLGGAARATSPATALPRAA